MHFFGWMINLLSIVDSINSNSCSEAHGSSMATGKADPCDCYGHGDFNTLFVGLTNRYFYFPRSENEIIDKNLTNIDVPPLIIVLVYIDKDLFEHFQNSMSIRKWMPSTASHNSLSTVQPLCKTT